MCKTVANGSKTEIPYKDLPLHQTEIWDKNINKKYAFACGNNIIKNIHLHKKLQNALAIDLKSRNY